MSRLKDLSGQRFGKWLVIERAPKNYVAPCGSTSPQYICKCDCGNIVTVIGKNLSGGHSTNCGCVRKESLPSSIRTHGDSRGNTKRLYSIYNNMINRCYNSKTSHYDRYGGRGISVCQQWRGNYEAFRSWAFENGYRDDLTIDRIDNDGNYEPDNCQWISAAENTRKMFSERKK